MDKIKKLLEDAGMSQEFSSALLEELETYLNSQKKVLEDDFNKRLQSAKQVCIEEVDKEKGRLARKVEIFLESKSQRIEEAVSQQRNLEESTAVNTLRKVKAHLEGIPVDEKVVEKVQSLEEEIEALKRTAGTLKEERDIAVNKANRANKVAANVLRRNQKLLGEDAGTGAAGVADKPVAVSESDEVCDECGVSPCECDSKSPSVKSEGKLSEALKKHQFKKKGASDESSESSDDAEPKDDAAKAAEKDDTVKEDYQPSATGGTRMDQDGEGVQAKSTKEDATGPGGGENVKMDQDGKAVESDKTKEEPTGAKGGKKEEMDQPGDGVQDKAVHESEEKDGSEIDHSVDGSIEDVEETVKSVLFGEGRVERGETKTSSPINEDAVRSKKPRIEAVDGKIGKIADLID